jgi:hypothetical protein
MLRGRLRLAVRCAAAAIVILIVIAFQLRPGKLLQLNTGGTVILPFSSVFRLCHQPGGTLDPNLDVRTLLRSDS